MSAQDAARLDYLAETELLLWPRPEASVHAQRSTTRTVLPSMSKPRVLAPTSPNRAASSAVLRYSAQQGWVGRSAGVALAVGVRLGAHRHAMTPRTESVVGTDSIDDHLSEVLGEPVLTSLALSPDRANRKPVLQVFDARGHTLAFAKVGVTELSARLVLNEAHALVELTAAGLEHVQVPTLLDCRPWHSMPVMVMSALPALSLGTTKEDLLVRAMLEVSRVGVPHPVGLTSYIDGLEAEAVKAAPQAAAEVAHWRRLRDEIIGIPGLGDISAGAWHGDWTTWNCLSRSGQLSVWDWERFARPVPTGFDRLHYFLNRAVGRTRAGFPQAAPMTIERAPELLEPWGVGADEARIVGLLYVLDLAMRYIADDQRASGRGGAVERWAFPTLTAALAAS